MKKILLLCFLLPAIRLHAQVPLKVWDQVIGTSGSESVFSTTMGPNFKMVKMSYGMALVYTSNSSGRSGNVNTDDNPGNKGTGVVFGLNADGSKRFDRRFLAQNCAPGNCYTEHYTGFNAEYLLDAVQKGSGSGNLLVAGYLNSGTTGAARFITHYEINSNGQTVFGQRLFDPYFASFNVLIKYDQSTIFDTPNSYNSQSFIFTGTSSSGGINNYIHDDGRSTAYNLNCFQTGTNNNIGFIRRNSSYVLDESGLTNTNKANMMGEKGVDLPVKVLSGDDKFFPEGMGFLVCAITSSRDNCFWDVPARGGVDVLLVEVDKAFNKKGEIRIGSSGSEQLTSVDVTFTADGNILLLTMPAGGSSGAAGGDFSLSCGGARLYKFNRSGNKIWEKCLPVATIQPKLVANEDGGFMVFDTYNPYSYFPRGNTSRPDITVRKFDANGNQQWDYRFGSDMSEGSGPLSVVDLGNDEYAFATVTMNDGTAQTSDRSAPSMGGSDDIWVMKFKNYPRHSLSIDHLDKPNYLLGVDPVIRINYTVPASYNYGNQFYAQLSDANGNFTSNVIAGIANSSTSGQLVLSIPTGTVPGNNYRVRVISTEPRDTSLPSASFSIQFPVANSTDSLALVNLYNNTGGSNWTNKGNWLTSNPLRSWQGVLTNNEGRVIQLILPNNNLSGPLPSSLGNIAKLQVLALPQNNLTGNIPTSIGNLADLGIIDLMSNQLTGSIPTQLTGLTYLTWLDLTSNQLTGSIPSGIGNLQQLRTLHLGVNALSGGIPSGITNLTELTSLDLSFNPAISGTIPQGIGNLTKLTFLWLGANNSQLSGTLPSSLNNLVNIERLIISNTQITGNIPSLSNLSKIKFLSLSGNRLSGPLPSSIGNLTSLTDGLMLNNNQFTGPIPSSYGNLVHVKEMKLNDNLLSGTLPQSLTSLSGLSLQGLDISSNMFNFDGMQFVVALPGKVRILPQQPLTINRTGCDLSVTAGGDLSMNTYVWLLHNALDTVTTGDSTRPDHKPGQYMVQVQNAMVPGITLQSQWLDVSGILPAQPQLLTANAEVTDPLGWTHYDYRFTNSSGIPDYIRLLSLKKNGNDLGSIATGTITVKVAATGGAGSGTGLLLSNPAISNQSGYYVMHRYWSVTPAQQPASPVGVRFYYNEQDFRDVKGSVPWIAGHNNLYFYKSVGGNPDPTTDLNGATNVISINPGSTPQLNAYVHTDLGCGKHMAEYLVAGFSGGGGGGTVNGLPLPVKLLSFTGGFDGQATRLLWASSFEQDASHFNIQRSSNGTDFQTIGRVNASGNSTYEKQYHFTDAAAGQLNAGKLYYRLQMVDIGGHTEYSKTIAVTIPSENLVMLSPNPANQTAQVIFRSNRGSGEGLLTMFDLQGRAMLKQKIPAGLNRQAIDLSTLATGVYWVEIRQADYVFTTKLIKY